MKIKGFLKGLFGLFFLAFTVFFAPVKASATSINLTQFTELDGTLSFGSGIVFNFSNTNVLHGVFENGIFSLIGDNVRDTAGRLWDLNFNYGNVINGGSGKSNVEHPVGNYLGGLTALGDYTIVVPGPNRDVDNGDLLEVFSRGSFAATFADISGGRFNFATWLTLNDSNGSNLYLTADPKLVGSAGTSPASVPEPVSMSLLGMGLIGGIVNRRKRATA